MREEDVEVEDEGVHFDAPVRSRDELKGRREVELLGGDFAEVEVFDRVRVADDGFGANNIYNCVVVHSMGHCGEVKACSI